MIKILKTIPVRFFAEESGREPARDWLKSLDSADRKVIGEDIKTVQLRWPLGMPLVRRLEKDLWEIRSNLDNRIARLLFTFKDGYIILLHGFVKKSQKTPTGDLALARKRIRKVLNEVKDEKK